MKVSFRNGDYTIYLNREENELEGLKESSIESRLIDSKAYKYLDKNIKLEFGENNCIDGLCFKYMPEGSGWRDSTDACIKINQSVIDSIRRKGYFVTRYLAENKLWIYERSARDYNERYSNLVGTAESSS